MKTLPLTYLPALLLLAAGCSKAQAEDPAFAAKAKPVIEGEIASRKLAGLAIAVVKDGKIRLAQGYGMADLTSGRAATPATVFSTASVSKPFCAIAALQLEKEGVISLDDEVAKYIKEAPAAWKGITMRHLLQHTSGIPDYTKLAGFAALYGQDTAPAEILKHLAGQPLEFAPGTRFEYSNSGFWVAALALERATRMP